MSRHQWCLIRSPRRASRTGGTSSRAAVRGTHVRLVKADIYLCYLCANLTALAVSRSFQSNDHGLIARQGLDPHVAEADIAHPCDAIRAGEVETARRSRSISSSRTTRRTPRIRT